MDSIIPSVSDPILPLALTGVFRHPPIGSETSGVVPAGSPSPPPQEILPNLKVLIDHLLRNAPHRVFQVDDGFPLSAVLGLVGIMEADLMRTGGGRILPPRFTISNRDLVLHKFMAVVRAQEEIQCLDAAIRELINGFLLPIAGVWMEIVSVISEFIARRDGLVSLLAR